MKKLNLTEKEASAMFGPSVHWFRRARHIGDGPEYIKLNGMVLYPADTTGEYFNNRRVKSTSDATTRRKVAKNSDQIFIKQEVAK